MRLKNLVSVMGLSLALGAAFSLSELKSGEGASQRGGGSGVAGSPEKSGSKRVRRLSRGRFIGAFLDSRREERVCSRRSKCRDSNNASLTVT
jgi:hypothetical protein